MQPQQSKIPQEQRKNIIRGISNLKERVQLIEDFLNKRYEVEEDYVIHVIEGEFTEYVKSKAKVLLGSD